ISRFQPSIYPAIGISPDKKIYFRIHSELMVMNSDGSNLHLYFDDVSVSRFFDTLTVSGVCPDASGNIWFSEWGHSHTYFYSVHDHSFKDLNPDVAPYASNVITFFVPYSDRWMIASSYANGLWLIDRNTKTIVKYFKFDPANPLALQTVGINYSFLDRQGT